MKTIVTPVAFSACDDLAQPVDVAPRQGRGRLVEQQDARLAEHGARDLDLLPDGEIERRATSAPRSMSCSRDRRNARAPARSAARRRIMPIGTGRRVGQQHVVERRSGRGRSVISWNAVWMPQRCATRGAGAGCTASPNSRIVPQSGLSSPRQQLDHGRLAGAVLAEQRMHLPLLDRRSDTPSSADGRAEGLADVVDLDRHGGAASGIDALGSFIDGIARAGALAAALTIGLAVAAQVSG